MVDDEIDEIAEKLEEDGQDSGGPGSWTEAHEKYDDGDTEMLENLIQSYGLAHKYKAWNGLMTKKGKYIDYDEWHATSWSSGLVTGAYIGPPLFSSIFATTWIITLIFILKHSWSNCKGKDAGHWVGSIQEFGFELPYYMGSAVLTVYLFEHHTGYTVATAGIGSLQILLEVGMAIIGI